MVQCRFGTDYSPITLDNVHCSSSEYLVILQCSFSTSIDFNCVNGRDDVSVTCCEFIFNNAKIAVNSPNNLWHSQFQFMEQPIQWNGTTF